MKLQNFILAIFIIVLSFASCRKDLDFDPASANLGFSRDTVYLDTVFTTQRSETYSVKVFNHENKDVYIPRIYLENGNNSYFKINVDGASGYDFQDVPLRAKDSLYVFVEIAPAEDIPNLSLLVEDLKFQTTENTQSVKLVSLVEDAEFFFPAQGESDIEISSDTEWNSDKSKVIFGNLKVSNNAKLTINQDSKVYFHKKSSLIIDNNASLEVIGSLNHEVVIRGDRQDLRHDTLPANWEGIKLYPNSQARFNYTKIKGGYTAIEAVQAQLEINNSQVYNFVSSGIVGLQSYIRGSNLLMNNCGETDIALIAGGDYQFVQCTLANYFPKSYNQGVGNAYSVYLSDSYTDSSGNTITGSFTQALFANSMLYNQGFNAIGIDEASFSNFKFDHCLIHYSNTNSFDPSSDNRFVSCWYNEDPLFTNIYASVNNLSVSADSFAKGKGASNYVASFPTDYYGNNRSNNSTLGAIE